MCLYIHKQMMCPHVLDDCVQEMACKTSSPFQDEDGCQGFGVSLGFFSGCPILLKSGMHLRS